MTWPKTFREFLDLWPSSAELARRIEVDPATVRKWRSLDSIPCNWWHDVAAAGGFTPQGGDGGVEEYYDGLRMLAWIAHTKRVDA